MNLNLQAKLDRHKKELQRAGKRNIDALNPSQPLSSSIRPSAHSAFRPTTTNRDFGNNRLNHKLEGERGLIKRKIIKKLQDNHKEGSCDPLTLLELKDDLKLENITRDQANWLESDQGLGGSPQITVIRTKDKSDPQNYDVLRYKYKPKYDVTDKSSLTKLLILHHKYQLGGILKDDLIECMHAENVEKAIKSLKKHGKIYEIETHDQKKKTVYFYNDNFKKTDPEKEKERQRESLNLDETHLALWRQVPLMDDQRIAEYLQSKKLTIVQNSERRDFDASAKKKKGTKRKKMEIPMK